MKVEEIAGIVSAATALLPAIAGLVSWVEGLFGKGQGAAKKQTVQDVLAPAIQAIADASKGGQKETWLTVGNLLPAVSNMIEVGVAQAKILGVIPVSGSIVTQQTS